MRIDDNHMYHGAALIQIAEDQQFTAINSLKLNDLVLRNAYRINDDIGFAMKYSTKPKGRYKEYLFTFSTEYLEKLSAIHKANRLTPPLMALFRRAESELDAAGWGRFARPGGMDRSGGPGRGGPGACDCSAWIRRAVDARPHGRGCSPPRHPYA